MILLGYSKQSAPSAFKIAEASDGNITLTRTGPCDINWGRRRSASAKLNGDISLCVDKKAMRLIFADNGVPSPRLYPSQDWAEDAVAEGVRLVGRPDFHTRGRGFWICETVDDVRLSARGRGRKRAATHWIEYIDPVRAPKEFRVHIFAGQSIRMSMKDHKEFHNYTTLKPPEGFPKRHVRRAAKAAISAVGLDFGVVDIMASEDQNEVWVLEVNAAPGLGGSNPKLWADTFISWEGGKR